MCLNVEDLRPAPPAYRIVSNETILPNQHEGEGLCQLFAGKFRLVCSYGFIAGDSLSVIRAPRRGKSIKDAIIECAFTVAHKFDPVDGDIKEFKAIEVKPVQKLRFSDGMAQSTATEEAPTDS